MTVLNDIKSMQGEGKTEQEIIAELKAQGISPREITEALTQSRIKEAVSAPETGYESSTPMPGQEMPMPEQSQEMNPSMTQQEGRADTIPQYAPQENYAPAEQSPQAYQEYPQQPQMGGISPDTITEISEQVVSEKLSPIRRDLEKVLDMKTTMDSKLEYFDERLKRIEKIIDRLQLSIMQKVGDYMTNIDDIKKEIVETQKSFKAMSDSRDKPSQKARPSKETPDSSE